MSAHWIDRVADDVERFAAERKKADAPIVCASGITPSGAVHLGNLREIITVHFVVEELKQRGRDAVHVHSWDDFDRFRKVPFGLPETYAQYIGRPVCDVPDVEGQYSSYAQRHIEQFQQNVAKIGIFPKYIQQSREYRAGRYNESIKTAMAQREAIFQILRKYQTKKRDASSSSSEETTPESYYPYKPYCDQCGKDSALITDYDAATSSGHYVCSQCGHESSFRIDGPINGKLVWKVDWPMRWAYYGIDFEPGGEDHASPGSSYTVGKQIVKDVFNAAAPTFIGYAFVGASGRSKISSSAGTLATPAAALDILEPPMLRWLYLRRNYSQSFTIDFGPEMIRLYDEWDGFVRTASAQADAAKATAYQRCVQTAAAPIPQTQRPVSFRMLSSLIDVTDGNQEQVLNILADELRVEGDSKALADQVEPRLSCAARWRLAYVPEDERTHVRTQFDASTYDSLPDLHRTGLATLVERMSGHWDMAGLTGLVYGIPKILLGLPEDAPPDPQVKQTQREFFISLYRMLVGEDTGPRLPTLLLSIGLARSGELLLPPGDPDRLVPTIAHDASGKPV